MPKGWPTSLSSSRACNPASHLPKMPYYCGQSSGHSPSMWCLYGSVCYGLSTVFVGYFFLWNVSWTLNRITHWRVSGPCSDGDFRFAASL